MSVRSASFFLAAVVAGTVCIDSSHAAFVVTYGFDNSLLEQSVNFAPPSTGISIVGDTNPGPVYTVTATSLEGQTLRGNGGHVGNNADSGNTIVGLKAVKFVAQPGYAWTYFDVQLDSTIVRSPAADGLEELTFRLYDYANNLVLTQKLDFPWESNAGENQHYYAKADGGDSFSRVDIVYTPTLNTSNRIHEIHNIDVASVTAPVPEPASIAMWGLGAIGMMFARRKRQQKKLAA